MSYPKGRSPRGHSRHINTEHALSLSRGEGLAHVVYLQEKILETQAAESDMFSIIGRRNHYRLLWLHRELDDYKRVYAIKGLLVPRGNNPNKGA